MGRTFTFVPAYDRPVWSTAPLTTRMVSPYRDRAGRVHIFADSFDPSEQGRFQDRLSSWAAVQRYYSTADFERFDDHGVVVGRGRWTGDPATSDADCVGAGSPGVTVAGDRVLLFYAGRGPADPAGPFEHSMNRADLPGQIMLAIAPADADGAPEGPFVKRGAVTDYGARWRSVRHDDPRPVVTGDAPSRCCDSSAAANRRVCSGSGTSGTCSCRATERARPGMRRYGTTAARTPFHSLGAPILSTVIRVPRCPSCPSPGRASRRLRSRSGHARADRPRRRVRSRSSS